MPSLTKHRTSWSALVLAIALASSLALAACGGGDGDGEPEATATAAEQAPTEEPTQASADSVEVGEAYWHAGFKVTLGDATLTRDGAAGVVTIDATFENLGDRDATPDSQLALTSGGNSYTESSFEGEIPQVPAGLTSNGTLAFDVDDAFSFDDAMLIVGNPNNNRAFIPFRAGGEELVTLEPQTIVASGTGTAGAVTARLTGAELRADLPNQHSEMEAGKLALTVSFDIDVGSGIAIGQGVFQSQNVALIMPDGTAVAVRSDGVSGVNELLQGKEGTTISDLSVRFEVDDPAAGAYMFVVRGNYGPGGEMVEDQIPFDVP
ncbi:MAG: hypothetical protein WD939_04840 [Dehalococcoidia bacterium]